MASLISSEWPERKEEDFDAAGCFSHFAEGKRSSECSNSLVRDSIVLVGLASAVEEKVFVDELVCK